MTHIDYHGKLCECGFGERLQTRWQPLSGSERAAKTDARPYEGQMYHGSPRGLLGPVRTPFFMTTHEPEAQDYGAVTHPVQVRFNRPAYYFGDELPSDWREAAEANGHDGIVLYVPEGAAGPKRQHAIALDPGTVVPGHQDKSQTP